MCIIRLYVHMYISVPTQGYRHGPPCPEFTGVQGSNSDPPACQPYHPSPLPPNSVYSYQVTGRWLSLSFSFVLVQILSFCLKDFC